MDFLQNHIEALIFCSPYPIKIAEIISCLSEMFGAEVPEEDVIGAIQKIEEKYIHDDFSFSLEQDQLKIKTKLINKSLIFFMLSFSFYGINQ